MPYWRTITEMNNKFFSENILFMLYTQHKVPNYSNVLMPSFTLPYLMMPSEISFRTISEFSVGVAT